MQFGGKWGCSECNVCISKCNVVLVTYERGWPGDGRGDDGESLTRHHQGIPRIS